jgi:hypothetical protein
VSENQVTVAGEDDWVRIGTLDHSWLLKPSEATALAYDLMDAANSATERRWERIRNGGKYDKDGMFVQEDQR